MPKFDVTRTTTINAPQQKVYGMVRNLQQWVPWSPWLSAEPSCKLEYADDGKSYTWDGKIVGSGKISLLSESADRLEYDLHFFKPWKSQSKTTFTFRDTPTGVEVTWQMQGSLPFFMFWAKKMMAAWVGSDYERGLAKLKDYAETGEVPSKLQFIGPNTVDAINYMGIRNKCSMKQIGPTMERGFKQLMQWSKQTNTDIIGVPFSISHKFSFVKGTIDTTCAIPIQSKPTNIPSGFVSGQRKATTTYQIIHTGEYRHLSSGWSAGMMRARNKLFKQDKSIPPFEEYQNDPATTDGKDLVTTIHFPIKH